MSDEAISESVSKLNQIISYDDTDSDNQKIFYLALFVPRLDFLCILLYFLSVNNYLQMLTLDFASF